MSPQPDWGTIATIIREHSATFYYGSLLLPGALRRGAWAIYAACRKGDDAVDHLGRAAWDLEAWWEGIERAYRGVPHSAWEEGLSWAVERWPIPQQAFAEMYEGFLSDLGPVRLTSMEALYRYCYRVAGTVGQMIAPLCGAPAEAEEAAVALGEAMQLTNCLRDVGEDLRMDRVYLPQEALEAHGVRLDELRAGQVTPAYRRLMRELAEVARQLYRKGFQGLRHLSQGRPAIALAALQYQGILDKLEAQGWDNLNRRVSLRTHERMALVPRALLLR